MSRARRVVLILAVSLVCVFAALAWLAGRESVAQWLAARATAMAAERVEFQGVHGSLYGPLHIDRLRVDMAGYALTATQVDLDWRPRALLAGRLTVTLLSAQQLWIAPGTRPTETPTSGTTSLRLPLAIQVQSLRVAQLRIDLAGGPYRVDAIQASAEAGRAGVQMHVQAFDGAMRADVNAALNEPRFALAVELRALPLGAIVAAPIDAVLSGEFHLDGDRQAFALRATLDHSRIGDYPLTGAAQATWSAGRARDVSIEVVSAGNRLHATGNFGRRGDRLDWLIAANQLARLGVAFRGRLNAHGYIADTLAAPRLSFNASARDAQLGSVLRVGSLRADGTMENAAEGRVQATLTVRDLRSGARALEQASLEVRGTRAAHTIALNARLPEEHVQLRARGGWAGERWRGRIERVQAQGLLAVANTADAQLSVSRTIFALTDLDLRIARGHVHIASLQKDANGWRSRGDARGLALAALKPWLPAMPTLHESLQVKGEWDIAIGRQLQGYVAIAREAGDVTIASDPRVTLGLTGLQVRVAAQAGALSVRGRVAGARVGVTEISGRIPLAQRNGIWGVSRLAPFALDAHAAVPSIAWLALLSPTLVRIDGVLDADLHLRGTLTHPLWSGVTRGRDLRLSWPDQGLALRDGDFLARFNGDQLILEQAQMRAGDGQLSARGQIALGNLTATLAVRATQATVTRLPDREVVVSGSARLAWLKGQWQIIGDTHIDRARIELPKHDAPTLSDDVIVVGRKTQATAAAPPRLRIDLGADLGEHFYLKGRGLDARLAGEVRVRADGRSLPTANGSIRVAEGTYSAYGQRLTVERGILNFSGPVDNPGLDLLALRKDQTVQAGVAVTGTALHPVVKLVSQPEVSDSEKLAWLVLGHGLEGSNRSELDLVGSAAGALLAQGESVSLQARIAQRAGLDEFRVSGNGGLEQAIVTVGKRVSSRAYVSYEHGITAATDLVKIRYTLSKRWSVQTQSGSSDTAVDLFYTWRFD